MATGLLIRDFNKDERELRYKSSGSIAFSEIEHNAYRLSLTLEITHIDAPRYSNLKTLPENTHFGYATLFRGSTVTDSIAIKYPKFRVFDIRNDGIWQYHQHTESIKIIDRLISEYGVSYHAAHLAITESTGGVIPFPKKKGLISLPSSNDEDYGAFTIGIEDISDAEPLGDNGYRAFPIASPFPDIVKFKGDIPCSFLFRLEMWYLVNPAVYIVDNPTDTGDKTDDEDEYPSPDEGDGDGDGDEFPASSPFGPGRDPRDFGGGEFPGGFDPTKQARLTVAITANDGQCVPVSFEFQQVLGMISSPPVSVARGEAPSPQPCSGFTVGLGFTVTLGDGTVMGPFGTGAGVISVSIVDVIYV